MNKLASKVRSGKSPQRSGLTLIELMIAVTLTLVIIAVMVRAFKLTSDEIGVGRARMDMHNQLAHRNRDAPPRFSNGDLSAKTSGIE